VQKITGHFRKPLDVTFSSPPLLVICTRYQRKHEIPRYSPTITRKNEKKNLPHHFIWGKALRAGRPWNKRPQLHLTTWGRALISGTTPLLIHYPTLYLSVKKSPLDHHLCPSFLFITASHCTTINKYLENFNACNPNVCIISWTQRLHTIPYSKLGKVGTTRSHQDKLNCFSISIKSPTTKCKPWMSPHGKASCSKSTCNGQILQC
jgi:hypothetical protein